MVKKHIEEVTEAVEIVHAAQAEKVEQAAVAAQVVKMNNPFRMTDWLVSSMGWFLINIFAESLDIPGAIRDLAWKLGVVSLSGYIGFRLDRRLFGKYELDTASEGRKLCRAITVVGFLLAVALAL